ncbi:hypothetical protein HHK36_008834 [Tetracentron sinense]|uniref:Uncharacterized protein n=1 Tax=Tetracentron sinense TaxID=13715 RepID=A0A835DNK7_TETSI|nr:hypothetical protein HHK36_008834 [Tetracentron sinense]
MEECMRKLALWYTKTFKPIMTHDELDPIMATLGFVSLPPSVAVAVAAASSSSSWKEYVFSAGACRNPPPTEPLPRPRLPYPRIDGLHICTYRAFLDAVCFYLDKNDISDLFHIRFDDHGGRSLNPGLGMPLHRIHDRNKKFRRMEEDDSIFVYREGTLDQATLMFYKNTTTTNHNSNKYNTILIRSKTDNTNTPLSCVIPLKDLV